MALGTLQVIIIAILMDFILGEPPAYLHPVVAMGKLTEKMAKPLKNIKSPISGVMLTLTILIIFITPIFLLDCLPWLPKILLSSFLFSTTFSIKFLFRSVIGVKSALKEDVDKARSHISHLVSRDTSKLSSGQLVSATIESLTENITDSIVSPILFFIIFGLPGAMIYRVINTLDAMVGYKDAENRFIGWVPARVDDVLNYIPARITGFIIMMAAFFLGMDWKRSLRVMLRDGRSTPSPNSGYPMAAAAGALGVKLEKPGIYYLGDEINELKISAIDRALKLAYTTVTLFLILSIILGVVIWNWL